MHRLVSIAAALLALGSESQAAPTLHQPAPPLPIQAHGPSDTVQAIYKAEKAFEYRSENAGAATAYAEFLDGSDALDVAGGPPVRGTQAIAAAQAKALGAGKLKWRPHEVFASTRDPRPIGGS